MDQEIRFCAAPDGVRIAYAVVGDGTPLVKAANYLNHLEYDWQSPVWRHVFRELARDRMLVRYDERGTGPSDWRAGDLSFARLNPKTPPKLETIILKALEKERDLRYQTALDLRTDLQRLRRDARLVPGPAAAAEERKPWWKRLRPGS